MASSERLHSKASLLKTREASKDQKQIIASALQNGCSKIGKALGESLSWSSVLVNLLEKIYDGVP